MLALQADHRLQSAVVGRVDVIYPTRIWVIGGNGDAVEELLGPSCVAHEVTRAVQLPGNVVDVAALLDHGIDAIKGVAASGRDGQPAPSQGTPGDGWVGTADQDAIAVDGCCPPLVTEAQWQCVVHARVQHRHVTGIGQVDAIRQRAVGSDIAWAGTGTQADHRPGHGWGLWSQRARGIDGYKRGDQ